MFTDLCSTPAHDDSRTTGSAAPGAPRKARSTAKAFSNAGRRLVFDASRRIDFADPSVAQVAQVSNSVGQQAFAASAKRAPRTPPASPMSQQQHGRDPLNVMEPHGAFGKDSEAAVYAAVYLRIFQEAEAQRK